MHVLVLSVARQHFCVRERAPDWVTVAAGSFAKVAVSTLGRLPMRVGASMVNV